MHTSFVLFPFHGTLSTSGADCISKCADAVGADGRQLTLQVIVATCSEKVPTRIKEKIFAEICIRISNPWWRWRAAQGRTAMRLGRIRTRSMPVMARSRWPTPCAAWARCAAGTPNRMSGKSKCSEARTSCRRSRSSRRTRRSWCESGT